MCLVTGIAKKQLWIFLRISQNYDDFLFLAWANFCFFFSIQKFFDSSFVFVNYGCVELMFYKQIYPLLYVIEELNIPMTTGIATLIVSLLPNLSFIDNFLTEFVTIRGKTFIFFPKYPKFFSEESVGVHPIIGDTIQLIGFTLTCSPIVLPSMRDSVNTELETLMTIL